MQVIHDVGSLCISGMWVVNFFLVERNMKQELQRKETSGKRDQGKFNHRAVLHHHPSSLSSSSFYSSSSSSFSSSFRTFGRPPGPTSSPAGFCRTLTGKSTYRPGFLLPPCSKIMTVLKLFTTYKMTVKKDRKPKKTEKSEEK